MGSAEQAPPREGALIRVARKARGLSAKEAAQLVPIRLGEGRWYHIESGTEGRGKRVVAPAETIAHMAHVVGLTPDQVTKAGRADAAEILTEILRQETERQPDAAPPPKYSDPGLQAIWEIAALTEHERRMAILAVELHRRDARRDDRGDQQHRTGT